MRKKSIARSQNSRRTWKSSRNASQTLRAANSSVPVVPVGSSRDRVGMATGSGNPNVFEEAASAKPYGRAKDGPAWREGLRNATQPMNLPGNSSMRNMRSRRPITY
jgi:hypothetical protein